MANNGQQIINSLTKEDLNYLGSEILQYTDNVAKFKARRFIFGLCGELTNFKYDESINYGDMHKVVLFLVYLESKGIKLT